MAPPPPPPPPPPRPFPCRPPPLRPPPVLSRRPDAPGAAAGATGLTPAPLPVPLPDHAAVPVLPTILEVELEPTAPYEAAVLLLLLPPPPPAPRVPVPLHLPDNRLPFAAPAFPPLFCQFAISECPHRLPVVPRLLLYSLSRTLCMRLCHTVVAGVMQVWIVSPVTGSVRQLHFFTPPNQSPTPPPAWKRGSTMMSSSSEPLFPPISLQNIPPPVPAGPKPAAAFAQSRLSLVANPPQFARLFFNSSKSFYSFTPIRASRSQFCGSLDAS